MVLVHPEYAYLILEINELREEIAELTVEKDMLNFFICKDLKIDYMLKIGFLEYKLLIAQNKYDKNKRRLEIINEKQKNNKKIYLSSISRIINSEFKDKEQEEKEMSELLDFAIEISAVQTFDYDLIDKMNVDYFKLQKAYNPVLNFDVTIESQKYYKKIQKYYEKGNYKKLHKLVETCNSDYIFQDEISTLKLVKEKYYKYLEKITKEIRKIKTSFPYNQKSILEEENLCRRRKANLNRLISDLNVENSKLEKKIEKILKKQ